MSNLVDKLGRFSKTSPQMGFRPASAKSAMPTMLLIAGMRGKDIKEAEAIASSIDAGLIFETVEGGKLRQIAEAMGNIPVGVFCGEGSNLEVAETNASGGDFIVFDMKMPIGALETKELGKFLAVEMSLGYDLIRPIGELEIDGVLLVNREPTITIEHLLFCRRFGALMTKPLLMEVAPSVTKSEINGLWEAGIDGIVASPGQPPEQLSRLREVIADLPQRRKRERGEIGVALPHYGGMPVEEEEEEEEEEI
jgi:CheY-like chemotaxis protein